MFGKTSSLKTLETRKQLLLAESEVNRIELLRDLGSLKDEIVRVKKQVRTIGSIASSAALLATALSMFRRRARPEKSGGAAKIPWISAAFEGARVGASLFKKVRSYFHQRDSD